MTMAIPAHALFRRIEESARAARPRLETEVTWRHLRITVAHSSMAVAEELSTRLEPYCAVRTPASPGERPDYRLSCVRSAIEQPNGDGTRCYLRLSAGMRSYSRAATVFDLGGSAVVVSERLETAFAFRKGSHAVGIAGPDNADIAKAARRVVQDLVRLATWPAGIAIVEASAVAVPGRGAIVIAGPSMAGKTVMLTRLLRTGIPEFLGNDEVMVETTTSPPNVWGAPVHVMVRPWLAERCPELADIAASLRSSGAAKQSLHYPDFAGRFNAGLCRDAPLAALVFLDEGSGLRAASATEAREKLSRCRLWDDGWVTPWRALGVPGGGLRAGDVLASLAVRCAAFVVGREAAPATLLGLAGDHRRPSCT
jgi:hypothetical protein